MQADRLPDPVNEPVEEQPAAPGSLRRNRTMRERPFTNEVIAFARDNNWEVFHIHDQDSRENYRKLATGSGFPDLVMFRTDPSGKASMIVAELKVDEDYSVVRRDQREWLNAYQQFIPTYEWRPSDWEEIEQVIEFGPSEDDGSLVSNLGNATESRENVLPRYLSTIISNLRNDINEQEFSRGDRASLRRMDIERLNAPAFQKLVARRNLSGIGGENSAVKWATTMQGIALLSDYDVGKAINFGEALFTGGDRERQVPFYSETRLCQLLAARGSMLRALMARAFRMLASAGLSIYWFQVSELILNDEFNEREADRVRDEIAADYYAAQVRSNRRATQSTESSNE